MRQKLLQKCSHYIIGASFDSSISLIILYYSDMFMKYFVGNIILGETVWELQGAGIG